MKMQYRKSTKLVIDKRKLDVLIRLGCPDRQLLDVIKTGKFKKTGDSLLDETLECLVDIKDFKNWGGNHNPKGKNQFTKEDNLGQVDHQVEGQLEGQDIGQVVDKDRDIDKEREKDKDRENTPNIINKEDLIKRMGELIKKTPKGGLYE